MKFKITDAENLANVDGVPSDVPALVLDLSASEGEGAYRRLLAAGDLAFAGELHRRADGTLKDSAAAVRGADLAFVNLETPIVRGSTPEDLFAAPDGAADIVVQSGFNVVNLANNHIQDHGAAHLTATRQALEKAGAVVLGAGADPADARRLQIVPTKGAADGPKIGWLAAARTLQTQETTGDVFWEYDFNEMRNAVVEARKHVDVVVVSLHMGYLYVDVPHPDQRRDALALVHAGADIVLMHHAHVLQGVETVAADQRKGVICYNLGNLLLDWNHGVQSIEAPNIEDQKTGAIFLFDIDSSGVRRLALLPTRVDEAWRLRWATGEEGRRILERVERLSQDWDQNAAVFHRQMSERVAGLAARSALTELRRGGWRAALSLLRRLRPHHLRMVWGALFRRRR